MNTPAPRQPAGQLAAHLATLPVFFVGGLPRSGTTWIQQLLDAHANVACLGESHFANDLAPRLRQTVAHYTQRRAASYATWAPTVTGPDEDMLMPVLRAAFVALVQANLGTHDPGALVAIGEKTPDNLTRLPLLWKIFPQARFIHVIRDGRDAAASGHARFHTQLDPSWSRLDYVREYAKGWRERITLARAFAQGRDGYLELRYEDMHTAPEAQAARLFRFLGAPHDRDPVAHCLQAASFERLSGGRRRGEVDADSHYRRGEVGSWRDTLSPEEVAVFENIAGDMLDTLGYVRAGQEAARP
ncbi:MAG: sulfotransferase [Proteobacteria bacterium]|nr:MAG: sulfotransferase [Pseudomonadota bacterium]